MGAVSNKPQERNNNRFLNKGHINGLEEAKANCDMIWTKGNQIKNKGWATG